MPLVRLPDGATVLIRPVTPQDVPLFVAGWEGFGDESRYRRFLVPKHHLSTQDLEYLTDVDHVDHEALGAVEPETGAGLGVARYVRDQDRPDTAEAAVAVIDAWQGRGVGGALLRRLCRRALANGITTFTATLLTENRSMLRLFERLGRVHVREIGGGTMEIDVELPVDQARTLLRSTATKHVRT
jgi:GNAT superfamily N-acetyltransferase